MFIRNVTEALPTNDVHRHAADGVERPANRSRMSAVFLIRHVSHPTHPVFTVPLAAHPPAELLWRRVRPSSVPASDHHVVRAHTNSPFPQSNGDKPLDPVSDHHVARASRCCMQWRPLAPHAPIPAHVRPATFLLQSGPHRVIGFHPPCSPRGRYALDGDGDAVFPTERRATRCVARRSSLPPPIRVQPLCLPQCRRIDKS